MTYAELLQSSKWSDKRNEIVQRDKHKCQKCLNEKYLEKKIVPFNIQPYFNKSIIIINEHPYKILIDKKFTYFLSFKSNPKEPILIILETSNEKIQVLGFCVLNILITDNDLKLEHQFLINQQAEKYDEPERKKAIIQYLMATTPINNIELKTKFANRYIRENFKDENSIKWFDIKNLHVHHKYYQYGKLPWEYPDEALTTLCWNCHEELHKNEKIPNLDNNGHLISELTPCSRCFGAGCFPEYNHIQNGICFKCNGAKYEELA
jgi:hypothetical protein